MRRLSSGGRSGRASLNAIAAGIDYGARTIVEFVVTPLLVSGLGTVMYGAWRVLWRMTGYLWAGTGRSAQALQWVIASKQSKQSPEDLEDKRRYIGAALVVWVLFLPIFLAIGALAVWLAPALLHDLPRRDVSAVRLATALLILDSVGVNLLAIPQGVMAGENLAYKRMGLSTLLVLAQGVLFAVVVELGYGLVGVAVANFLGTVLFCVVWLRIVRHVIPWFGMAKPTRSTVRWLFGLSSWFTGWKLVMQLMIASDVMVLGFFGSLPLVTVFSLTKTVPEGFMPLMAALIQGIAPGLGGIIGEGDLRRAVALRGEIMAFTWISMTALAATVLLWNQTFVSLWIGHKKFAGNAENAVIMLMILQFMLVRTDANIIDLTLDVKTKVLAGLASAVLAAVLAAVFVSVLDGGIVGLCAGIMCGRMLLSVGYPWQIGRTIGHPLGSQLVAALRPAAITLLVFAVATPLGARSLTRHWLVLIPGTAVTALAVVPVIAYLGLNRSQRRRLLMRVRRLSGAV